MPSPFPGMDPYLEQNPIFHELHTQMLAAAQAQLQPRLRPKYIARLERHLSEGSVWGMEGAAITLDRKEPDLTLAAIHESQPAAESTAVLSAPTATFEEELDDDELQVRRQRRIVIYVNARPRLAVAALELLSPANKSPGATAHQRYVEKRSSALNGGLHWIEIDLLRGGQRMPVPMALPPRFDYLAYIAQATPTGRKHYAFAWNLPDALPLLTIPLLGTDQVTFDLSACFRVAYDAVAADTEVDYAADPPDPKLQSDAAAWLDERLRQAGLRA